MTKSGEAKSEEKIDWSELKGIIDSYKTSIEMEKEMWKKID